MSKFFIDTSFYAHRKTRRLCDVVGNDGIVIMICLWTWTAANRPDGVLTGMDGRDIELAAQWTGEPGKLISLIYYLSYSSL